MIRKSPTDTHINLARELAEVCRGKGIDINPKPKFGDIYIDADDRRNVVYWVSNHGYAELAGPLLLHLHELRNPFFLPAFERALEVLKEWGWRFHGLVEIINLKDAHGVGVNLNLSKGSECISLTGQDSTECGLRALIEAAKKR